MFKTKKLLTIVACIFSGFTLLSALIGFVDMTRDRVSAKALNDLNNAPTIAEIQPQAAPNDLDTPVVIGGTGFAAVLSGTQVITPPQAYLGDTKLADIVWVNSTTLSATLPWGLDPGVYTLTVQNPNGEKGSLPNTFTVTQGIRVWNSGELYGGAVENVTINPHNPATLFANTRAGLFRSQDSAGHWDLHSFDVHMLVYDPVDANRIYAEGNPHNGGFLWRSDDGGDTWIPLTTTFPITNTTDRWCWSQIKIYPTPDALYISDCGGDFGGVSPAGLLKSEDDGETWDLITTGMTDTQISAVAFHPSDPLTMYAGTVNGNLYVSKNGGDSWNFASRPVAYVEHIAVAPYEDHAVWVSAGNWYGDDCGMYKSDNADLTSWTLLGEPAGHPGHLWCASKMFFAPETWPTIYSHTLHVLSEGNVFTTTDGGTNFVTLPLGKLSGDIRALALHPTNPETLYAGESGTWDGFYKSTDGGMNWQVANYGLTAIVPEELLISPDDPQEIYALSLGSIYYGTRGGTVWQSLPISGVVTMMFDPFTTTRLYAGSAEGIYISDDRGQSWPTFITVTRPAEFSNCWLWFDEMVASPTEPGTLIAGVGHFSWGPPECTVARGSLWRSTNYGEDWTRINLSLPISQVNAIFVDPISPTLMYAAIGNDNQKGGNILRSEDAGLTWIPAGNWSIAGAPFMLAMEPGSHRIFASVNNLMPIYVSDDFGTTWTPTGFSEGQNIQDILFVPGIPSILYDAAQQGLYRSSDGAQTWQPVAGVLGQVPVYSLAAATTDDDRVILYAGTAGGVVEPSTIQQGNPSMKGGLLVNAGVYRLTTVYRQLYLPLTTR